MNCFSCGHPLSVNSMRCPNCGFAPDVEFARKCPNLQICKCLLTDSMCNFLGKYQTCPIKNKADSECPY